MSEELHTEILFKNSDENFNEDSLEESTDENNSNTSLKQQQAKHCKKRPNSNQKKKATPKEETDLKTFKEETIQEIKRLYKKLILVEASDPNSFKSSLACLKGTNKKLSPKKNKKKDKIGGQITCKRLKHDYKLVDKKTLGEESSSMENPENICNTHESDSSQIRDYVNNHTCKRLCKHSNEYKRHTPKIPVSHGKLI